LDEPVVVFCRFRQDIISIQTAAVKAKRKVAELSGHQNDLIAWQCERNGATVLAVQIQAGALGIDLTRAAYCVFYSTGLSLGDYEQSLARLDRPGQTRSVTYIHLLASGTIDEKVHKAFRQKRNVIEDILKGKKDDGSGNGIDGNRGEGVCDYEGSRESAGINQDQLRRERA
jgi:SNF2 family DNA or RNA helicase